MDLGLKDRVAFVSGASSGLGLACATALACEGCRVAVCSRQEQRIRSAAERIREEAEVDEDRVLPIVCDVTDEEQIREALGRTVEQFGKLEILITNAGGPPSGYVEDFDAAEWRAALELNLMSTVNLTRHALPYIREAAHAANGFGRIVMITSISAKQPIPSLYLSNASRAGVQGFAKSLAEQVGPEGITVNTVLPSYTRTERLTDLAQSIQSRTGKTPAEVEAGWAGASALKRLGEPDEFASVVAFLA
ncbi:MAG TPA: SDR family NAD(P)-dependent oxidoreductase, partial [Rhodothermales bacterium]|nr:SDR family NAD(P)-dependent oxidoreductase [Rhodothermales bacterium]